MGRHEDVRIRFAESEEWIPIFIGMTCLLKYESDGGSEAARVRFCVVPTDVGICFDEELVSG